MKIKNYFRLVHQECPLCGSHEVKLSKSLRNYFLVAIDSILGFFLVPPFSYFLRCGKCAHEYKAELKER